MIGTFHKIKHISVLAIFFFCSMVFLLFLSWWVYPYKTIEMEQPYHILTKTVEQGGLLKYEINYCKYTDVNPRVNRQFIDGIIYATPEATAVIKKGCGTIINTIGIPHNLPNGNYKLKSIVSYEMNPIRIITHEYITEEFSVIK